MRSPLTSTPARFFTVECPGRGADVDHHVAAVLGADLGVDGADMAVGNVHHSGAFAADLDRRAAQPDSRRELVVLFDREEGRPGPIIEGRMVVAAGQGVNCGGVGVGALAVTTSSRPLDAFARGCLCRSCGGIGPAMQCRDERTAVRSPRQPLRACGRSRHVRWRSTRCCGSTGVAPCSRTGRSRAR